MGDISGVRPADRQLLSCHGWAANQALPTSRTQRSLTGEFTFPATNFYMGCWLGMVGGTGFEPVTSSMP
jgi:hypothetical protein